LGLLIKRGMVNTLDISLYALLKNIRFSIALAI